MTTSDRLSLLVVNPMGGEGWGGVERWLFDLATGLRERGHRVATAGRPETAWLRRCSEAKIASLAMTMRGDFSPGEARALANFSREHAVDVIATKLHKGIRVAGTASRLAGGPPVVAFMGLVETAPGWRYRMTYRLFLDRVVTLSGRMREEIVAAGRLDPARVVAIPYGVRVEDFVLSRAERHAARRELGFADDAPIALGLGRLHEQKRFDRLVDAFADVRRRVPGATLVIAGEGRLRGEIESRAARLGLADAVRLVGFRRDVARLLAAADCLAMSSDDEGLPMVVLEAMASARPVVATDVGSISDQVEDGRTGFLVPREDVAALADSLVRILGAPDRGRAMGLAARERVASRFPLSRCIEETERYLLSVRR